MYGLIPPFPAAVPAPPVCSPAAEAALKTWLTSLLAPTPAPAACGVVPARPAEAARGEIPPPDIVRAACPGSPAAEAAALVYDGRVGRSRPVEGEADATGVLDAVNGFIDGLPPSRAAIYWIAAGLILGDLSDPDADELGFRALLQACEFGDALGCAVARAGATGDDVRTIEAHDRSCEVLGEAASCIVLARALAGVDAERALGLVAPLCTRGVGDACMAGAQIAAAGADGPAAERRWLWSACIARSGSGCRVLSERLRMDGTGDTGAPIEPAVPADAGGDALAPRTPYGLARRACIYGDAAGCTAAGELAAGRPFDNEVQLAYSMRACELCAPEGCMRAALRMYSHPRETGATVDTVVQLYERACALNGAAGCYQAAVLVRVQEGAPSDRAKALYERACRLGYAPACNEAGRFGEAPLPR